MSGTELQCRTHIIIGLFHSVVIWWLINCFTDEKLIFKEHFKRLDKDGQAKMGTQGWEPSKSAMLTHSSEDASIISFFVIYTSEWIKSCFAPFLFLSFLHRDLIQNENTMWQRPSAGFNVLALHVAKPDLMPRIVTSDCSTQNQK